MPPTMNEEQKVFWDDVQAQLRWALSLINDPEEVQTFLEVWGRTPEARRNLELARRRLVPLKKGQGVQLKHVDKLKPSDAPAILAFWEDTYAGQMEHLDDDSVFFKHLQSSVDLIHRWRSLRYGWLKTSER
jgi:hypothetical protein